MVQCGPQQSVVNKTFFFSYDEGEECPEELVIHFTVAQWSSNTVRDCIAKFGARIIEVRQSHYDK